MKRCTESLERVSILENIIWWESLLTRAGLPTLGITSDGLTTQEVFSTQFRSKSLIFLEEWFRYDDDIVDKVTAQNIQELKGGGDWHIAYYLIYRKKEILKDE